MCGWVCCVCVCVCLVVWLLWWIIIICLALWGQQSIEMASFLDYYPSSVCVNGTLMLQRYVIKIRISGCERGGPLWWGLLLKQIVCAWLCESVSVCLRTWGVCVCCVCRRACVWPCHMINVLSPIIYVLQNMMYVRMNFEL